MYISTRGSVARLAAAQAIAQGMAPDGGLFVPESIPAVAKDFWSELIPLTYEERATAILRLFLTDYSDAEIRDCVAGAYGHGKFTDAAIAPVIKVADKIFALELWHGPTSAFKDMALQLLPRLLSCALKKIDEQAEIVILVATSGDTGKAALEGFKDVEQTQVMVFYPEAGVSEVQRLQMVTQQGSNLKVIAVKGNFDDTQTAVKQIFSNHDYNALLGKHGFKLSSANSINWGRLVPQIVYYFSAYADLVRDGHIAPGTRVNFVVPTGNFGNILAGYYARLMGLPVNKLICASNSNNVLTEFLTTGVYNRNRQFYKTVSPSMDILISSNLERLLYHIAGDNAAKVNEWMVGLTATGQFKIDDEYHAAIEEIFPAAWVNDEQTSATISRVYKEHDYVLDPHTAVAWQVAEDYLSKSGDTTPLVMVSTASPFKFNETVLTALGGSSGVSCKDEFAALRNLADIMGTQVPVALAELETKSVRHTAVCAKEDMPGMVKNELNVR